MSALKYWIWMTTAGTVPASHAFFLLEHFGSPEAAYAAAPEAYKELPLPGPLKRGLLDKSLERAEGILEDCRRLGLQVLTYQDTQYPERLRQIEEPPCVLYIKGHLPQIDDELCIGIVGARKATPYGEMTARRLGTELARQGAVIVSGSAVGIDSAALKGALLGGGKVVSVLGNGIDVIYPRGNGDLYEDVAAVGALVSEYPPGTPPEGIHFPVRNRIISGLSLGTLVVEGNERSGSLITARLALEQNRDVFATPGNWDAPMSRGPNRLLQKGEAKLVLEAWDILEEYQEIYPHKLQYKPPLQEKDFPQNSAGRPEAPKKREAEEQVEPVLDLSKDTLGLTDDEKAILLALSGKLATADDVIEASGIPARRVLSALTMLQVGGHVVEEPGRRFRTVARIIG